MSGLPINRNHARLLKGILSTHRADHKTLRRRAPTVHEPCEGRQMGAAVAALTKPFERAIAARLAESDRAAVAFVRDTEPVINDSAEQG